MRIRIALAAAALAAVGVLATAGGAAADDLDINYSQDVPLPDGSCSVVAQQGGVFGSLGLGGAFGASCNGGE